MPQADGLYVCVCVCVCVLGCTTRSELTNQLHYTFIIGSAYKRSICYANEALDMACFKDVLLF